MTYLSNVANRRPILRIAGGVIDIEAATAKIAAEPSSGMIATPNAVTFANAELIIALAASHRIPAIYPFAFYSKAGGLISYGFDAVAQFQEGAGYVDKLLRALNHPNFPFSSRPSSMLSSICGVQGALGWLSLNRF